MANFRNWPRYQRPLTPFLLDHPCVHCGVKEGLVQAIPNVDLGVGRLSTIFGCNSCGKWMYLVLRQFVEEVPLETG